MPGKLIIVSNRLPVTLRKRKNKPLEVRQSSGGLVSAIQSLPAEGRITWIGAADFRREVWEEYRKNNASAEFEIVPVFLEKKLESLYYNGFSNALIWPLFHYFPSYAEYDERYYKAYRLVNQVFAEKVREVAAEGDMVWIHDYHLMLLPGFLKDGPKPVSSSFFLHIPFPSYELVKLIPEDWRNEVLNSLLACDVVGFHTPEYTSHFKRAISYFLGIECVNSVATVNGHGCFIGDYPISVDFDKFNGAYDGEEVVRERNLIRSKHAGCRIVFSLDRLDYTKGVINRLQAYELLLKTNESLREKIIFIINVIPSREAITTYLDMKKLIEENISRINGEYGSIQWQPVIYQYRHLSFNELLACYTACDVALVTPLRDGMNLVAKEFVASRKSLQGVLILSEFAGAVHELGQAILVNPNDIHLMQEAMQKALDLPAEEQEQHMTAMRGVVKAHDVKHWAGSFMGDMKKARKDPGRSKPNVMSFDDKLAIFDAYRESSKRLILLDYDGTLIQFFNRPEDAVPGDVVKEVIARLAVSRRNRVMLISGRDPETLQSWFAGHRLDIVAEHGGLYRPASKEVWVFPGEISLDWKDEVKKCVTKYVAQVPGSFIEEKKYSIAWHYRASGDIDEEALRLSLSKELLLLNTKNEFDILHGNKVVEIKSANINKGKFVAKLLSEEEFDFVLAFGDDITDEDMFGVLKGKHHFTVKVGLGRTAAKYNVIGVNNVISFLEQLSQIRESLAGRT